MKSIYIFTLNGCSHCAELKKKLSEINIPFHDVEITRNKQMWEAVKTQTGFDILPTVFMPTDDMGNGLVYTPGRDFQDVNEIIEIIKKNI
jgi:glutaredoxin